MRFPPQIRFLPKSFLNQSSITTVAAAVSVVVCVFRWKADVLPIMFASQNWDVMCANGVSLLHALLFLIAQARCVLALGVHVQCVTNVPRLHDALGMELREVL